MSTLAAQRRSIFSFVEVVMVQDLSVSGYLPKNRVSGSRAYAVGDTPHLVIKK